MTVPERVPSLTGSLLSVNFPVILGCVWRSSIPEIKSLPRASKYGLPELRFPCADILTNYFQFMGGSVCPVEDILSRQPNLKVLRDPPSLADEQRVRCVLTFHYRPGQGPIEVCKVRAQAWSVPLLYPIWCSLGGEASTLLANGIFDLAKTEFGTGAPDKIRAREMNPPQHHFL